MWEGAIGCDAMAPSHSIAKSVTLLPIGSLEAMLSDFLAMLWLKAIVSLDL
jgi:hypothetical protein